MNCLQLLFMKTLIGIGENFSNVETRHALSLQLDKYQAHISILYARLKYL